MKLYELVNKDCSKAAVLFHSKKRILEYISELGSRVLPHISEQVILNALLTREKLGSTGIGRGIALPHGRISGIENALVMVLVNQEPIDFDAIDGKPVDIFVALLVPEDCTDLHLKILSTIADKLNDKQFCKQLRAAKTDQELYQAIIAGS